MTNEQLRTKYNKEISFLENNLSKLHDLIDNHKSIGNLPRDLSSKIYQGSYDYAKSKIYSLRQDVAKTYYNKSTTS